MNRNENDFQNSLKMVWLQDIHQMSNREIKIFYASMFSLQKKPKQRILKRLDINLPYQMHRESGWGRVAVYAVIDRKHNWSKAENKHYILLHVSPDHSNIVCGSV